MLGPKVDNAVCKSGQLNVVHSGKIGVKTAPKDTTAGNEKLVSTEKVDVKLNVCFIFGKENVVNTGYVPANTPVIP